MAKETPIFDPDDVQPFAAYRRLTGESWHLHDLAISLAHFYEAEKPRGVSEELRQEVLACPTARAARKLTKRHATSWRSDWRQVRAHVLRAGLSMQMVQSLAVRQSVRAAFERSIELGAQPRLVGGIPGTFLAHVISSIMEQTKARAGSRLGVLALKGYEPPDLEARLDALFAASLPVGATVYIGKESSSRAEAWCMHRGIPLRYVGEPHQRLRPEDHSAIGQRVNTLLVCAPSARKAVSQLVVPTRRARTRIIDLTQRQIPEPKL